MEATKKTHAKILADVLRTLDDIRQMATGMAEGLDRLRFDDVDTETVKSMLHVMESLMGDLHQGALEELEALAAPEQPDVQ
jgi:hypothetical protein